LVITYTGRVSVDKGIPVLVEALGRLPERDVELVLVGGCGTGGMRRWLRQAIAADSRIRAAPGDPVPELARAHLHVHPTWEDGLGYGPLEAVASGVPALVTEDTGMKDRLGPDDPARVLPTGDVEALRSALEEAIRRS
jgi:glycosyltransferase involved in cell wall biosynthesis